MANGGGPTAGDLALSSAKGLEERVELLERQIKQLQSIIDSMSNFPPGYGHNWMKKEQ